MARIDKGRPPRKFDFKNGSPAIPGKPATDGEPAVPGALAVAPSIIYWSMGTSPQWDDYERRVFEVFGPQTKRQKPTNEQTLAVAGITREFCWARIQKISGFEAEVDGAVRDLVWPADKTAVVQALLTDYAGHCDLFVRTVIGAHRPADENALEVDDSGN